MMTIMLDPHFKSLHIVEDLLGHGNAIRLAIEYDAKIVIPFLMVCFEWLNPITISASTFATTVDVVVEEFEEICLVWRPQLKNLHMHWLLESYFYLRGFLFCHMHV
jgi:hypothetical protein